ncbi:MAG: TIGR03618 family F420-dependent PPOX class oxidoreductase [Chloroflexota bacterium]
MTSSAAEIERLRHLVAADHGLAVVATQRRDGSVQASVVNAGVLDHPVTEKPVVAFVAQGGSAKLRHLRHTPRATIVFRSGWQWIAVEGPADLAGPDDSAQGIQAADVPRLLRDIFIAAGGTHDDWDTYDRVMAEERRAAVFIHLDRIYSNPR